MAKIRNVELKGRYEKMFRRARVGERDLLDEMTLAGARHWGHDQDHPDAYLGLVGLLGSQEDPAGQPVFVFEEDGQVIAFYELRDRGDHVELLRMFMHSHLIGHGYGKILWNHAVAEATLLGDRMLIMSDPGAIGFYTTMGATLERHLEVAPEFSLGVLWYDLR